MDYQVVTKTYSESYGESEYPEDVLGEVSVPENARSVDIKCKSVAPPLVQVSYLVPVNSECDECGSGGGGLCPECKDKVDIQP